MSMWQFYASIAGYAEAHDPKARDRLSDGQKDELADWLGI